MQIELKMTPDEITAAFDRYKARVTELLHANNREVERRRAAEAEVHRLRELLARLQAAPQPRPQPRLGINDALVSVTGGEP